MNDSTDKNSAQQALESLDWDVTPDRDLWPDIYSNIRFSGKPKLIDGNDTATETLPEITAKRRTVAWPTTTWKHASIAACLMLAFGAFVMSSLSYRNSLNTYEMQASFIDYQKSQISLIEQQHAHVRAQFVALLDGEFGYIDPYAVAEVRSVLLTIDEASLELKEAILAEPLNKNYAGMLARTYQEELKLLNKFKARDGRPSGEVSL